MLNSKHKTYNLVPIKSTFIVALYLLTFGVIPLSAKQVKATGNKKSSLKIEVLSCDKPFFDIQSVGFEEIKYGFEGGKMVKIGKFYHLITTEMPADPHAVKTHIAHWKSADGSRWDRVSTLYESDADTTGESQRAALWGPMPVFLNQDNKWHLFYVAYKSEPNVGDSWKLNKDGIIVHAVSEVRCKKGISGPYKDKNILMRYDVNPDKWEGQQGVAAFFPYKINRNWYAFYGTSRSQHMPTCKWLIGMAQAPEINEPWTRMSENNPTDSTAFAENPIVYKLDKNVYLTLVDGGPWQDKIGYLTSIDGVQWSKIKHINFESVTEKWWQIMRTPVGLFKEKDGSYTLFFTAYISNSKFPDKPFSTLSRAKLKIKFD